jgi:pimeloyl-ACP methyl ester carboxylesterase
MAQQRVNGVNLYYQDRGDGAPTVLIHGCGDWALGFADAVTELAKLGRVTAYDRRGCARSERPEPDKRTSVAEHTDAAALLDALEATPAIVTGRSCGERSRPISPSAIPTECERQSCSSPPGQQ